MKHPPTSTEARISEIFSSLQGEGTHLGERHIFIRFEECNIHCTYCDELDKVGKCMSLDQVIEEVKKLEQTQGPHRFVSLTGGEPLIYLTFLKPLMKKLKELGFSTYLETSGILWKALEEVIELCDCVAMDMKPSSVTGERNFDQDHRKFLQISKQKETFIKIILSKQIIEKEFFDQVRIIQEVAPKTPLILQPISTEREGYEDPELMELLQRLQKSAMNTLRDVRIVPRFHKILKIK